MFSLTAPQLQLASCLALKRTSSGEAEKLGLGQRALFLCLLSSGAKTAVEVAKRRASVAEKRFSPLLTQRTVNLHQFD